MKKDFITGIVILLPAALTLAIIIFVFNLLTGPFAGIVEGIFDRYHIFEEGFLFLTARQIQNIIAKVLVLFFLFFLTVGLGFLARWFFVNTAIKLAEFVVKKIPVVSPIYKTCKEVIKTLFKSDTKSFKQVVLVKFPHQETYSVGLVTNESIQGFQETAYANYVSVFIPTTPNPTSGFLVLYDKKDLVYLDMKVEEAFKYVISCGVVSPSFTLLKP